MRMSSDDLGRHSAASDITICTGRLPFSRDSGSSPARDKPFLPRHNARRSFSSPVPIICRGGGGGAGAGSDTAPRAARESHLLRAGCINRRRFADIGVTVASSGGGRWGSACTDTVPIPCTGAYRSWDNHDRRDLNQPNELDERETICLG